MTTTGPSRVCGPLIGNAKTAKADRLKALLARAAAHDRKNMIDRAIADYDAALLLDPAQADVFNARGELWRKKGERRKALADFGAAIKLNPDHAAAKASHKSLAQELERARRADRGRRQAELQLRHRAARGGEGDLRAIPSLPISTARFTARSSGWSARPSDIRARRRPCSASRMNSSPAATPVSASPATICRRPCASGCSASTASTGTKASVSSTLHGVVFAILFRHCGAPSSGLSASIFGLNRRSIP